MQVDIVGRIRNLQLPVTQPLIRERPVAPS